ncbi:Crp/Fnr family transcriptional regulator [Chryseobacterium vrystaatense]|uniref:Cyclic nucleotide-binding protein n=1 Tax=Chryseobacterium vrystaatense TaxID=307480 RepID=A0A1M5NHB2_9FLAO|nr:Crp/Fnr family transcriptional regulator [Chryseobacterium vrystaatense]KFF26598.1 cyclic nucleotide-binding protein [Chryseobacterium vrystaatense]SHG88825.1 cAMP-binding domain of CRP or a regulatory subunit of cAMP-dependent protein kinases [Chryseobacterium vrystaatense]
MNKSSINHYFHSLFDIEEQVVGKITETFSPFELKANEIVLNKDEVSTKTFFLEKGYVRSFILNEDNEEITTNIYVAPCFVNDFLSFFRQQPAKETYQTITECSFWETGLENVQHNFHNIPEFREFSRLLFVLNYYSIHDRLIEMASQKASTRYSNLMKKHPDIFQYVPLKVIASYLGIKDSSLSRIRRDIHKM